MTGIDTNGSGGSDDERTGRARRLREVADAGSAGEAITGASRRDFLRAVGVGSVAAAGLATVGGAQQSGSLVVNDFDGDPAWPGSNDLDQDANAGDLANDSGEVVDGALRLEYDGAGWFFTNVRQDVSTFDRLEFDVRGDAGGEGEGIQLEVGGVEGTFATLADAAVTTEFTTVGVDLADAGVDRSSVDDVWLEFFDAGSGAVEISEIRFGSGGGSTDLPPVGDNEDPPTDPDGDGLYEDVNGNGDGDLADAVDLYQNRGADEVTDNVDAYDFSGNEEIDLADVVQLYQENT